MPSGTVAAANDTAGLRTPAAETGDDRVGAEGTRARIPIRAAWLRLGVDKVKDWDQPPAWAAPLAVNRKLITREERVEMKDEAKALPTPVVLPRPAGRTRRAARSTYLG